MWNLRDAINLKYYFQQKLLSLNTNSKVEGNEIEASTGSFKKEGCNCL